VKWALAIFVLVGGCSDAGNMQYLPIGSRCSSAIQCGTSPFDCETAGHPGGYCDKPCTTDGDCPSDSLCGPTRSCRRTCRSSSDCRTSEGYLCVPLPASGVCDYATVVMDGGAPSR
jgi:hypothetical protein